MRLERNVSNPVEKAIPDFYELLVVYGPVRPAGKKTFITKLRNYLPFVFIDKKCFYCNY